jgi:peptidoglycan/xylan/chitin deacetylase (PgdA/CDA1 family)
MRDGPSYVVLLFHSVDDRRRFSLEGLGNIRPEIFHQVCVALKREFDIVDLRELLDLITGRGGKKGRFLSVTFDDGPKSYALNAVPVLKSLGMPSACFLITDCIEDKAVYWRYLYNFCINAGFGRGLAALVSSQYGVSVREEDVFRFTRNNYCAEKNRGIVEGISGNIIDLKEYRQKEAELFLSSGDIETLKSDPFVTFGIHTRSHPVMKGLADEELREEIAGSAAFFRNMIGEAPPMFSVPFGRLFRDYDERTVLSALDLSVEVVLSAYGGRNEKGQASYNIRRIPVDEASLGSGVEKFVRQLSGAEIGTEYRAAEERLRVAVERRSQP